MSGSLYGQAVTAANQYGVPSNLFTDVIQAESGFDPNAYNPASGATGIAQFLPSTAANPGYGIAPFDPANASASLTSAAQYLSALFNKLGSWTGALNAYSGNTSGGSPYPGNTAIASDLSALGGSSATPANTTPQTSGTSASGTSTSCGFSPSCYLSALGNWVAGYASRGALIILAIILLVGAAYLFAQRSQIVARS